MSEEAPHRERLNPEQYAAVTTIEGPMLVLAGAGSGKTRVLTRRIAELLHQGVEPEHILAVTFTNKAAAEMKERVIELVGEVGAKVWVSTFHSSCARILRYDIEALGYTRRFSIYDDDDQARVIRQLIQNHGFDIKKYPPRSFMSQIDHYKNRMKGPDDVIREVRSHDMHRLLRIWRDYEEQLKAADAVDFNDLIGLVVRLFDQHPDILEKWRNRFRYILVDEYQDTNNAQYTLLRQLAVKHRNIAVVGDDDQSIYGFRGADISNILGFERDYPEAKVVALEQNYRCSGNILELANAVVQVNTGRRDKRLWTEAPKGPPVNLLAADTVRDEAQLIARAVEELRRKERVPWGDIAIIYRTNATSRPFEQALRDRRIPHRIVGGLKFYQRREVRDVLAYLRLVVNPNDDAAFLRVVNVPPRGIGAKSLAMLRSDASSRGQPLMPTARAQSGGSTRKAKAFASFIGVIDELTREAQRTAPPDMVLRVLELSGYGAMLEAEDTPESQGRLENLQELARDAMQAVRDDTSEAPYDQLLAWLDTVALSAQSDDIPDGGEVTLMTVHNAKGLEYPVVFVVQVNEGQFPHAKCEDDQVEEERRLAYVAFTRAKRRLVISYSKRAFVPGDRTSDSYVAPSPFLFGLPEGVCVGAIPRAADDVDREDPAARHRSRLQTFLRQRQQTIEPARPSGDHTLLEVEDPEQLQPGVRVLHASFGEGVIRSTRVSGGRLHARIAFGERSREVAIRAGDLQIVVD